MVAIEPLELWDVLVEGRSLFARRGEPAFFASLAAAAVALRRGEATRESAGRLPAVSWDDVAIVGGGVDVEEARTAFAAAGIALDLVSNDPFFAVSCAFADARADVVIDVGQTAIKAFGSNGRVLQPRGSRNDGNAVSAFAGEVARALLVACAGRAPELVLLALPCEVVESGGSIILGESSYATGTDGRALTREILERCDFSETTRTRIELVNDAVLAAAAVASSSACHESKSRLVLTIGHGVGGALVKGTA